MLWFQYFNCWQSFKFNMGRLIQSMKIIGLLKVCFWLGFIGWNLYLMWSSVNIRHNVRHIRTIPFLLPPEWEGSFSMHYIHTLFIHHLSIGGWFKRMELIEVKSLIWAQKGKLYITTTTAQVQLRWKVIVLLILMEFMIITVYKLSFHNNQWKELVC
jgi:hypothetical protein